VKFINTAMMIDCLYKLTLSDETYHQWCWSLRQDSRNPLPCQKELMKVMYPEHFNKITNKEEDK
jgi:hypothetical protein